MTGFDLGMNTCGGFGQYIRIPAQWAVKLPEHLTLRESMAYGTAGFTAALSVWKMEQHGLTKDQGEVLVTGATGGVGSIAVSILAKAGFNVVAATGKTRGEGFPHRSRRQGDPFPRRSQRHFGTTTSESALGRSSRYGRRQHSCNRD